VNLLSLAHTEALAPVSYSLRPYQTKCLDEVRACVARGARRIALVAPTGAGKSVLIGQLARECVERGESALVLQHRKELTEQNRSKVLAAGVPESWVGVLQGGDKRRRPGACVQVASVDTLRGWVGVRGMPRADWIFVDEAHRSAAASYQKILGAYPDAVVIGPTATPWRLDGKGLSEHYDELVVAASIPQLVGEGFLAPCRCFSHPKGPDLSKVKVRNGDFAEEELASVMRSSLLLGDVTEQYKKRADGRATFGFAVNIAHAQELAQACRDAGIPSVAVHGESDPKERTQALADLRSGAVKIVWNVQLFTEGTDVPEVKALILCRPTLSKALAFQMLGRGMRPAAHTGFADCVVLDHAGILPIHGHPLEVQDYSLTATKKKGLGTAQTKNCPECGETVALGAGMCACGHVWEREERELPQKVPGQLQEVAPRPGLVLLPAAEERLIRDAFRKAKQAEAARPVPYALSILRKQLRREPEAALFAKVQTESFGGGPKPTSTKPEWLKRGLGEAVAKPVQELHVEPTVADFAPAPWSSEEPIVEVSF
jgi:superfamily II DNA or RNA helicase